MQRSLMRRTVIFENPSIMGLRQKQFDTWWPTSLPFPPTAPWVGTAVSRALARRALCSRSSSHLKHGQPIAIGSIVAAIVVEIKAEEDITQEKKRLGRFFFWTDDRDVVQSFLTAYRMFMSHYDGAMNIEQSIYSALAEIAKRVRDSRVVRVEVEVWELPTTPSDSQYDHIFGLDFFCVTGIASPDGFGDPELDSGTIDCFDGPLGDPAAEDDPQSEAVGSSSSDDGMTSYELPTSPESGRDINGDAPAGSVVIADSEGYVPRPGTKSRKYDVDGDGKVSLCEWLNGVFGCVPPPWIPDIFIAVMSGDVDFSTSQLDIIRRQLDQQLELEGDALSAKLRVLRVPLQSHIIRRY